MGVDRIIVSPTWVSQGYPLPAGYRFEAGDDLALPAAGSPALALEDRWVLSRLERLVGTVEELLASELLAEA